MCEILDLARGEAEPLDRVVAQPHIAESIPSSRGDELPRQRGEHPPHRRARAREQRETRLDVARLVRAAQREGFHTNLVGTERVRATEHEDREWL